jgi:DNA-directed RNA polymerase specialized sigma subunit
MEEKESKRLGHLIIKAKSGDKEALNEAVERLKPIVRKYVDRRGYPFYAEMEQDLTEELIKVIHRYEPKTDWGEKNLVDYFKNFK